MITDLNKNLSVTRYNYLNLPEQIDISMNGLNHIHYLYDAAGTKLAKHTVEEGVPQHTTDYVGSFVYEDSQLQYLLTEEGRIVFAPDGTHEYQYFLKDHLGNTRVTFNAGGIIQEDSYYPFGMSMSGLSHQTGEDLSNKYLYNGKELEDDFGLDWYDYGFRFYDPTLGRFPCLDPKADAFHWISPYNYAENNPITFIDLWGLQALLPPLSNPYLSAVLSSNVSNAAQEANESGQLGSIKFGLQAYGRKRVLKLGGLGQLEIGATTLKVANETKIEATGVENTSTAVAAEASGKLTVGDAIEVGTDGKLGKATITLDNNGNITTDAKMTEGGNIKQKANFVNLSLNDTGDVGFEMSEMQVTVGLSFNPTNIGEFFSGVLNILKTYTSETINQTVNPQNQVPKIKDDRMIGEPGKDYFY
jgi:RHS repeat-associated protein